MHHKELEWQEFHTREHDSVDHPVHYTQGDIECIDAIKASMSVEEYKGFLKGTILAYLWRYNHKGGLKDILKAKWYINKLQEELNNV